MSAILSAEDLNDFISPGVACIKPIETLPAEEKTTNNAYEVTTEDKVAAQNPAPAQISLTDCLACSGCVTSAEAVLVSLQSHVEVLSSLERWGSLGVPWSQSNGVNGVNGHTGRGEIDGKIFVASVSPQVRASIAAVYGCSEREAGNMISQFLSGSSGLAAGGAHGSHFLWTIDTNTLRDAALVMAAEEMVSTLERTGGSEVKKPILTSACPGWICYAEKTHPYILPHLSRLKSPQALAGTLLKSVLAKRFGVSPDKVWHLAIMPCFDKKLEASRSELMSNIWDDTPSSTDAIRDVDCVITARELISMSSARGIDFGSMPRTPLSRKQRIPFPDPILDRFLFPLPRRRAHMQRQREKTAGTSGGYLWHILQRMQARYPGSRIKTERGRNADVVEYSVLAHNPMTGREEVVFKAARYYGFRNIQNLVRRLKPKGQSKLLAAAAARGGGARKPGAPANGFGGAGSGASEYAYVEVMACPGGCTNGGGQVRVAEVETIRAGEVGMDGVVDGSKNGPVEQRAWLAQVDEAYFSASSSEASAAEDSDEETEMNGYTNGRMNGHTNGDAMDIDQEEEADVVDGISRGDILDMLTHWSDITGVERDKLVFTSYREVESDVGKAKKEGKKVSDVDRVAGLAVAVGGGW